MTRENHRQLAEIERFILSLQEAEFETVPTHALWEDAQIVFNSWSCAAGEMCPTCVGSRDTALVIAVYSSTFLSRECSFFFIIGSFTSDGWVNSLQREEQQAPFGLLSRERPFAKQSQQLSDHRKITSCWRTTVGCSNRERPCAK